MPPEQLPIDPHLPALVACVRDQGGLVLTAEPGAGKTTRLPAALLSAVSGEIWVLEPRRLAARLAASHVARELGERIGETVGYQIRFDTKAGPRTRLRYVTEGVLVRRLSRGGDALKGIGAVVLDELHERHLDTDLALTLLEKLRRGARPDLRIVVMSATLDAEPVGALLGAPVHSVPGRNFPVTIEHSKGRDERPLEDRVLGAVEELISSGLDGHVLVFLPGVGEIHRAERALSRLARAEQLRLIPLHGQLGAAALETALQPSQRRKILLATNVAESSVTIDGVVAVIDSGLARIAGIAPQTGMRTLRLEPISRASAVQRAHRAGRQAPGRCLRLYTRVDFERRPRASVPEVLREDLSGPLLLLRAAGVVDVEDLRWLDPPPPVALAAADTLLSRLGATDDRKQITDLGRDLLRYPLSPRLAKVVAFGAAEGIGKEAARAAALLSERDIRTSAARRERAREDGPSDVLALLDLLAEAKQLGFDPNRLRRLGVDARAARSVDRVCAQLIRLLPKGSAKSADAERSLLTALLAGHPDRVAKRAGKDGDELILAGGGRARLGPESVTGSVEWLVALDAADTRGRGAKVSVASAILPEWLLDLFADELQERSEVTWSPKFKRVESSWTLSYGQLVLESSAEDGDPSLVSARLAKAAIEAGPRAFCDQSVLDSLCRRVAFARGLDPSLPELGPEYVETVMRSLCEGRRSFAELRKADLLAHIRGALTYEQGRRLEALAPAQVTLDGGRRCPVHYEARRDPWITSRLQDFFGMTQGPTIGAGSVPLVLHLLAPNKTAVSVTADLAGFWERHYPTESRRLSRRYPRHLWPDDPATAKPPRPGRIR